MNPLIRSLLASLVFLAGITACGGGGGGEATPPAQPTSLSFSGLPSAPIAAGQSVQLTATLTYSDASTQNVTSTAAWSTSNAAVLTVSSGGALVAVAPGQADVVVAAQGLSSRSTVRVEQPVPVLALFAGSLGGWGYVDGIGATARFSRPTGIATDRLGNVYVADTSNAIIRKITPVGAVSTLAGAYGTAGSADGPAAEARFREPLGVAADGSGNVYVADTGNHTIRRITPDGTVSTVAGVAGAPGSTDGNGIDARFRKPQGIAVDRAGNLYVADTDNYTVRKIARDGTVTTLAGAAGMTGNVDGPGSEARFGGCGGFPIVCHGPAAVAVSGSGDLYVADAGNYTIRQIAIDRAVSTKPGKFGGCRVDAAGGNDCVGPLGVAIDEGGSVYVSDWLNYTINKITADGVVTTLAGGRFGSADGIGPNAQFNLPRGLAVDAPGYVYVADAEANTIRKIDASGATSTFAGAALLFGASDGVGAEARFGGCVFALVGCTWVSPDALATDNEGNVYVADTGNHTIRKITPAGAVSTFAGSPGQDGNADGIGPDARFYEPSGVATARGNNVYVADSGNNAIRRISSAGVVTTVARTDGRPVAVAVDSAGNVYVSQYTTILKISPDGTVFTLAGTAGVTGSLDGPGAYARFNGTEGLALDSTGNLYVADMYNHTIRRITPAGIVSTLAGTTGQYGSVDGAEAAARFYYPKGLATDAAGNVYVADRGNHTIRKITPDGIVTTVVGIAGRWGFAAAALPGGLSEPHGVAISESSLYIVLLNGVAVVSNVP